MVLALAIILVIVLMLVGLATDGFAIADRAISSVIDELMSHLVGRV